MTLFQFGKHERYCRECRRARHIELYPHCEDTLYVMSADFDRGETLGFAVGRTCNTTRRLQDHNRGLPFVFAFRQLFLGAGPIEGALHRRLAKYRNTNGFGREWFIGLTLDQLCGTIVDQINDARRPGGCLHTPPGRESPRAASPRFYVDLTEEGFASSGSTAAERCGTFDEEP